MSVEAMAWALDQQLVADATARHVLLALANYAGPDGRGAFPSAETLSRQTGLSERAVRYKLDHLVEVGAIKLGRQEIAAAYIERADRRPKVYDICLRRGADGAPGDGTGCKPRQNGVQMVQERGAPGAPNPPIDPKDIYKGGRAKHAYTPGFELAWSEYPARPGANKLDAFKAWSARITAGVAESDMLNGVIRYRDYCLATGVEPPYIKQPATFFGPSRHYETAWDAPAKRNQAAKLSRHSGFNQIDYGKGVNEDGTFS